MTEMTMTDAGFIAILLSLVATLFRAPLYLRLARVVLKWRLNER